MLRSELISSWVPNRSLARAHALALSLAIDPRSCGVATLSSRAFGPVYTSLRHALIGSGRPSTSASLRTREVRNFRQCSDPYSQYTDQWLRQFVIDTRSDRFRILLEVDVTSGEEKKNAANLINFRSHLCGCVCVCVREPVWYFV